MKRKPSQFARRVERRKITRKLERHNAGAKYPPPDPTLPINTDTIPQIKHIIILMMENHSFDNYLGLLDRADVEKFTVQNGAPVHTNPDSCGELIPVAQRTTTKQLKGMPSQSWVSSHVQWHGGLNDGFVRSVEELPRGDTPDAKSIAMQYWTEEELPFYHWLAKTFPLADHWYCSCLGPTFPNRRFLIAGTAHGLIDDLPFGMLDVPTGGTIFDLLTLHDIDWTNYHSGPALGLQFGRLLGPVQRLSRNLKMITASAFPRSFGYFVGKLQFTADLYPLKFWSVRNHIRPMRQFFDDAKNGALPPVSIVDPDFKSSSEENPHSIRRGERFAARVIRAVMAGKGWPDSLLIWTYDEHGGYYDHVAPPEALPPDDVPPRSILNAPAPIRWFLKLIGKWKKLQSIDAAPGSFDQYGFRVPAVIVSPYSRPNFVSHRKYDHTSILRFIERKWNLPSLTARDHAANDFGEMLELGSDPPFETPPQIPPKAVSKDAPETRP